MTINQNQHHLVHLEGSTEARIENPRLELCQLPEQPAQLIQCPRFQLQTRSLLLTLLFGQVINFSLSGMRICL